jgi:hypothetical protein
MQFSQRFWFVSQQNKRRRKTLSRRTAIAGITRTFSGEK